MIRISSLMRLVHINFILLRHGLDEVIFATHFMRPLKFILYLNPFYWIRRHHLPPYPVRIRLVLEDLGPIFIKFGQSLSTRRDLLPDDIADELAKLQDAVPPFKSSKARQIIEKSYGHVIEEVLDNFEEDPLASASIAQVHAANLKDGTAVVVKVLRPGIEKIIRRDVALLFIVARLAQKYWKDGRRLRPIDVVREYERTLLNELDLLQEAANGSLLKRNWEGSDLLYVPEVYWDLTRKNVLVLERIYGTPVGHIDELKAQNISMKALGEQGVEIFFTQVFRDNFFHADMHPGNIFVEPSGRYIAIDFGIVGSLTVEDQRYLAENLLAFFNRDYRRVAELHVDSGWVPRHTRPDEFENAIRSVCEPIFNKPLSEISFGLFLMNLFQTARRFDMEIQPQLILLQKTLLYIEGLGRQLYPELDLWTTAKPYLEKWMAEQVGPKAFVNKLTKQFPQIAEYAADMPLLMHRLVLDAAEGNLKLQWESRQLELLQQEMRQGRDKTISAITGGALLISGALLLSLAPSVLLPVEWVTVGGIGLSVTGIFLILRSWMR